MSTGLRSCSGALIKLFSWSGKTAKVNPLCFSISYFNISIPNGCLKPPRSLDILLPLRQVNILGKGYQQSQTGGTNNFRLMEGFEFEVLEVLTYHESVFQEVRLRGETSKFFGAAPILPGNWRNGAFFMIQNK